MQQCLTVGELCEVLKQKDPNLPVVIYSVYMGNFDPITEKGIRQVSDIRVGDIDEFSQALQIGEI